jgi:CRISPR-associated protein Cmr6
MNYLFNVSYYDVEDNGDFSYRNFGKCNDSIINQTYKSGDEEIPFTNDYSFSLRTAYPGLLIGVGNTHEAGSKVSGEETEGAEIKLGFTIDFVTGLPIIPGSTVKGVLRSAFRNYSEYVKDIFSSKGVTNADIAELEENIFGNPNQGSCIFYDAIPVKTGKGGRLFGLDNITPHNKPYDPTKEGGGEEYKMNGLKNPIPLTMLKVISGVSFLFRFNLSGFRYAGINSETLKGVFIEILMDIGIGAKTNVGYGIMTGPEDRNDHEYMLTPCMQSRENTNKPSAAPSAGYAKSVKTVIQEGVCVVCGKKTGPKIII